MTTRAPDDGPRINEHIRAREILLIGAEGEQLGVTRTALALERAAELGLDLVEVAGNAQPPVCRLMDFGKYRFEQATRSKESRRKTSRADLKEMRFSVRIGPGDFETKTRKVATFLAEGHRVKVSVRFRRGREQSRPEFGRVLLDRLLFRLDGAKVESPPRLDGTFLSMLLAPGRKPDP